GVLRRGDRSRLRRGNRRRRRGHRRRLDAFPLRNLGEVVLAPQDQLLLPNVRGRADADPVLLVRRRRRGDRGGRRGGPARLRRQQLPDLGGRRQVDEVLALEGARVDLV